MHKKSIIADPTWEEQSTLDDHDYRASGDRRKEHVSSVGGGMKKYFFRVLARAISRCEEETWAFANVATSGTCVASFLWKWVSWFSSLVCLNKLLGSMTSWAVSPTQSTSWSHIIHFSRQFCEFSPCVVSPHINYLQSKTWNISNQNNTTNIYIYNYPTWNSIT